MAAGPKARALLARVTDADLSNAAFPWLSGRWIDVLGAMHRATVIGELSCDPGNEKLHG